MQKVHDMRFERILDNGRLWAVMYDGDAVNILERVFTQWNDYEWLRAFFTKHVEDLSSFFHITDIDRAVFDTVDDANDLECLIMDIDPDANLDELFRPLENTRLSEVLLGREKAKGQYHTHASWLYAIRLESGRYIITGGALRGDRERLVQRVGANDCLFISTPKEECLERAKERGNDWNGYVEEWFNRYQA